MENTRAEYLIGKSGLDDRDKLFMTTHLEVYEDTVRTLEFEVMRLKDIIEYNKMLDNKILTLREHLASMSENTENTVEKLDGILKMLSRQ